MTLPELFTSSAVTLLMSTAEELMGLLPVLFEPVPLLRTSSDAILIGSSDGVSFGSSDGVSLGSSDGVSLGSSDGVSFGSSDGVSLGSSGGVSFGSSDGVSLGSSDGVSLGSSDGVSFGSSDGVSLGSSDGVSFGSSDGVSFGSSDGVSLVSSDGVSLGSSGGVSLGSSDGVSLGSSDGVSFGSSDGVSFDSSDGVSLGSSDGVSFGSSDGVSFGSSDGVSLGSSDGVSLGSSDGVSFGSSDGVSLGSSDGVSFGSSDGVSFGSSDGVSLGSSDGVSLGSSGFFSDCSIAMTSTVVSSTMGSLCCSSCTGFGSSNTSSLDGGSLDSSPSATSSLDFVSSAAGSTGFGTVFSTPPLSSTISITGICSLGASEVSLSTDWLLADTLFSPVTTVCESFRALSTTSAARLLLYAPIGPLSECNSPSRCLLSTNTEESTLRSVLVKDSTAISSTPPSSFLAGMVGSTCPSFSSVPASSRCCLLPLSLGCEDDCGSTSTSPFASSLLSLLSTVALFFECRLPCEPFSFRSLSFNLVFKLDCKEGLLPLCSSFFGLLLVEFVSLGGLAVEAEVSLEGSGRGFVLESV